MSVDNASQLSTAAAVAKTMEDAPCELCKAARAGRRNSEQSPLAKQEAVKEKVKSDSAPATPLHVSGEEFSGCRFLRPGNEFASVLFREVPVPPPRHEV